jgi:hypothetical protein
MTDPAARPLGYATPDLMPAHRREPPYVLMVLNACTAALAVGEIIYLLPNMVWGRMSPSFVGEIALLLVLALPYIIMTLTALTVRWSFNHGRYQRPVWQKLAVWTPLGISTAALIFLGLALLTR